MQFRKKISITPAGYAILEVIKANCLEYRCLLKLSAKLNPPARLLLKTVGPEIWRELGLEVDHLFGQLKEEQIFQIKMILNELMQNSMEHSGSEKFVLYASQYGKELHLGCLDRGVSIPSKLTQKYELKNDVEFIEYSLLEGVSTRRERKGGLGLTHVFDYAKLEKGRLVIVCRNAQYRK